jgi:hypothetical protein
VCEYSLCSRDEIKLTKGEWVVDNKQEGDMIILIKLLVGDMVLNVIIAYVPQIGINESVKETVLRGVRCVS